MIANEDISFVVQGPVQASQQRHQEDGVTQQCIASIRQFFPGSPIIVSTWKGQDTERLKPDLLLELDDPGQNIVGYDANDQPKKENYNRQICSTLNGLQQVKTEYAVKIRSDNKLTGTGFRDNYSAYPIGNNALFEGRVVFSSNFFLQFHRWTPVILCPSDFFQFGKTKDLLTIWNIPFFEDYAFNDSLRGKTQHALSPAHALMAEQQLCQRWLSALDATAPTLRSRHSYTPQEQAYWREFIAQNLIVMESERLCLDVGPRLSTLRRLLREYSFIEWQELYRTHCDSSLASNKKTIFWTKTLKRLPKKLNWILKGHDARLRKYK